MNRLKPLIIIAATLFLGLALFASTQTDSVSDKTVNSVETYTRAQVDSLLAVAVSSNLETIVELQTYEKFSTYTNEVNNRLTWVAILVAIVTIGAPFFINRQYKELLDAKLEADRKQIENMQKTSTKLIEERQKDSKDYIDNYVKDSIANSKERINQLVEEGLKKVNKYINVHEDKIANHQSSIEELLKQVLELAEAAENSKNAAEKSARYAEFSVLLTRALTNKNLDVKLNFLSRIINEYDDDAFVLTAYNCRGGAYFEKRDFDKAMDDFTEIIRRSPDFSDAYYNRGNVYYEGKKDYDNAITDFTTAIDLVPDFALAYYARGVVYKKIGNTEMAETDFEKAKALGFKG